MTHGIKNLIPLTLGGFSIGKQSSFAMVPAMQMLMIEAAKGAEMLASSMVQSSANMGNTLGAYLGGLPIAAGFGYTAPEYVGIGLAFIGVFLCFMIKLSKSNEVVVGGNVS
jgi:DHA1 family arabinose polymer transporter-like MFS transporter